MNQIFKINANFGGKFRKIQINMTQKFLYESPEVEIIESLTEGVLCASNADLELDMNPEDGNM